MKLAALHLEGKALRWHHSYMSDRYGILPSWTDYVIAISERFAELYDDPLSELVALKQGDDSVEDFLDKFEELATRITLSKAHTLSIFLTYLNPHLAFHVRQFEVKNVLAAARIAKLHESSLLHAPVLSSDRLPVILLPGGLFCRHHRRNRVSSLSHSLRKYHRSIHTRRCKKG